MARWYQNSVEVDSVAIADRGFQYADGLFESIAIRGGQPRLWPLHSERLQTGCRRLGINLPASAEILSSLMSAVAETDIADGNALLKIIVTRGVGNRGYAPPVGSEPTILFGVFDATARVTKPYRQGIAIRFCHARLSTQPQTAGIKLLSRLDQVRARSEWQDAKVEEGLMLDQDGYVVCGTMSNLFIVRNAKLITPGITHCGVSGVMRQHILTLAETNSVACAVERISPSDVRDADEIFVCNSQFGIWPVARCGDKRIAEWPLTRQIRSLLSASGVVEGPE